MVIVLGSLWGIFLLPMMLIFTVKNQQKNRVDVQPPRQLQFHDDAAKMKVEDFLKKSTTAEIRRAHPYQPPKELQYYDNDSNFEMEEQRKTSSKPEVKNDQMMVAVEIH